MNEKDFYNKEYYEAGPQSGKSLYQNYRWMPELTIPLAHHIIDHMYPVDQESTWLDFGCAKGYLVHALRLLGQAAYGVDVSDYAISQAMSEVKDYVKSIEPGEVLSEHDYVIAKDILEHIPYDQIEKQLEILCNATNIALFAIIPLGANGKYLIDAYEMDKSHYIRESVEWWTEKFLEAGFGDVVATTDLGPFKANWQNVDIKGNVLIIANKEEEYFPQ